MLCDNEMYFAVCVKAVVTYCLSEYQVEQFDCSIDRTSRVQA